MLLFLDTESNANTKEPEAVQLKWGKYIEIIKNFNHLERLEALWENCDAVIIHNAPYDLGVLASLPGNSFEWKDNAWEMEICGFKYKVTRLGFARNVIKPLTKDAPPVIDLLKLWNILVSNKDNSLKSLIRKELGEEAIDYSEENAKKREYLLQDVVQLEKLWYVFLEKVKNIPVVSGYSYNEWGKINSPATFVKNAYAEKYPGLSKWQKENNKQNEKWELTEALEDAYNGGITCAMLHGTRDNTAWYDIHGAYAHVIQNENMDRYKLYEWEYSEYTTEKPLLCYCETDTVLCKIDGSLKIYRLKNPDKRYMWNYDIEAMKCLFPDARINVLKTYYPRPLNNVDYSLPTEWSRLKEIEEREHGKTTLREYYKFLSNTSYGITAQRDPIPTKHTNMVVAGIITSRAHLILCQMIETARSLGCEWLYSDTDSICVDLHGCDPGILEEVLNKRIATYEPSEGIDPYSCGCEFIGKTRVLSLKRYIAYNGYDLEGNRATDKIRLHGKGPYNIDPMDMSAMLKGRKLLTPLRISQVVASTPITLKRCLNLNPEITHPHPFMFEREITIFENDKLKTKQSFFDKWITHIDTKTTAPENATIDDEFTREFPVFNTNTEAIEYFKQKPKDLTDIFDRTVRDWDAEDALIFGELK